jgi:hypothetical protein
MYLDSAVVNYSRGSQHPQYGKIRDPRLDKGDFIFTVAAGAAVDVSGKGEAAGKALLSVEADVPGARVLLDGREIGKTPLRNRETAPGKYRLRVEKEGYEPYEKAVTLEKGRTFTRTVSLSPETPRKPRLFVDAEPEDARVRILNIQPRYERGMELEAGRYRIQVDAPGCETRTEWVDLSPGRPPGWATPGRMGPMFPGGRPPPAPPAGNARTTRGGGPPTREPRERRPSPGKSA